MTVSFVATGPGDPELLTVRAELRLAAADLVAYDAAVSADVLALAAPGARLVLVDHDHDPEHLVRLALEHDPVVRITGGDRSLLDAGGAEAAALVDAGIDVEIVPGVLGAFATPALQGIPVMARDLAATLTIVVGTDGDAATEPPVSGTVVVVPLGPDAAPVVHGAVTEHPLAVVDRG